MIDIDTSDVIRTLASGGFICDVTFPEVFAALSGTGEISAVREDVEAALGYLGMTLKSSSEHKPEYFYAAPEPRRLSSSGDLPLIRKELNFIIANATGYTGFIELVDKATGMDTIPSAGFSFDLGEIQSALANTSNSSLQDLFLKVRNTRYFKSAWSNKHKNDKERLDAMFDKLRQDGLIADDGTGVNYAFTGKFSHYIRTIEYIRDASVEPNEEADLSASQASLIH